jgi:hypothetical protein
MVRLIFSLLLLSSVAYAQQEGQLSGEEKAEISTHLNNSWDDLENIISRLSVEQWQYKPVDSVWSIAEISEHLEKSENELFNLVTDQLTKSDPQPEKISDAAGKTQVVMDAITSRDHKVKTRPELEPGDGYQTPKEFLDGFEQLRNKSIKYVNQTEDKLRHYFISFGPLGDLDGYQILMFMSGHVERHIQQIEEVMKDPRYPSI